MKLLVMIVALSLPSCQASPGWKEGKKYVYEYTGKVGTGVSDKAITQFAGRGIKAKIHVYIDKGDLAVEFHDVKTAKFNKRMKNAFESIELNYQPLSDANEPEVQQNMFKFPFYGVYGEDGKIVASIHESQLPKKYSNGQRAILSLLQLVFPSDKSQAHYYSVDEYGIGGHCKATYVINHYSDDFQPNEDVMNITKNYLYNECTFSPYWFFSSWHGDECKQCSDELFNPLKRTGSVEYQVKGNRGDYTIERIDASGCIGYSPFTTNGQTAISITNQTLALVSIEDFTSGPRPEKVNQIEGLHYEFDIERLSTGHKDNVGYKHLTNGDISEKVLAQLEGLKPNLDNETRLASATKHIVQILASADSRDIDLIFESVVNFKSSSPTREEKDLRYYLLQLLPIVGTTDAIKSYITLIVNEEIPEMINVEGISILPYHAKSLNLDTFHHFERLLKPEYIDSISPSSFLFSTIWMAYGTLLFKACIKDDFNPHPVQKETFLSEEDCNKKIQTIVDKLRSASRHEEQNVFVRAILNTKSEIAFNVIVDEIAPNPKYDYLARTVVTGVCGFPNRDERKKERLRKLYIPIFMNSNEDPRFRMDVFGCVMGLTPKEVFFSNLVSMLNREPNNQVVSFIYTYLTFLAKSTDPCSQPLTKLVRRYLPLITPKQDFDLLRHSTHRQFTYFNEKYGFGRTLFWIYFGGNNTLYPREFYLIKVNKVGGYSFDFFDGGTTQRNGPHLEGILMAVLGQYNLMAGPARRHEYGLAEHDIFIPTVRNDISFMLFGQELYLNQNNRMPEGNAYFSLLIDKLNKDHNALAVHYSQVHYGELEYVIPNLMGLPTYLQLSAPTVFKVTGSVGITAPPQITYIPDGELDLDLNVFADTELDASMFVDTNIEGPIGYKLKTSAKVKFPFGGNLELNKAANQVKFKRMLYQKPYDFIFYKTQPSTYTSSHPSDVIPINYSEKPVESQYDIGHNYFGAGLKLKVKYDQFWNDYGYYKDFFKNFFYKSSRYEDYNDLAEKLFAGFYSFFDYAILNPKARPFEFRAIFEQSKTNPTDEIDGSLKWTKDVDQTSESKKIELDLVAKGPVERKWSVDLTTNRNWPVTDFFQIIFNFKRSSIPKYDEKPHEVCIDSKTKIQGKKEIVANPLNPAKKASIEYETTLKTGENCESQFQQVTFKGMGTQSEEQRSIDIEKSEIYQKCKEDYAKGYEYSNPCQQLKKAQGRLDHWTLDIEYDKNIKSAVKNFFYRLYDWFRYKFFDNLQIERDVDTGIANNYINVQANFSYFEPLVDVHITKAHEKIHYHQTQYEPITIAEPFWKQFLRKNFRITTPTCYISGDYINTLDGVQYKYALTKCWHVAVANSHRENVVLLFRGVSDANYTKAVKLVLDDANVTIEPVDGKLVVSADGNKILENLLPRYIHKNSDGDISFVVYQKYEGYVIHSKVSGLKVYFDGRNAVISVSNFYHGLQNGMCGDFNNERHQEFKGIDGTLYKTGAEFANSYMVQKGC